MKTYSKCVVGGLATLAMLAVPTTALAGEGGGGGGGGGGAGGGGGGGAEGGGAGGGETEQAPAKIKLKVKGLHGGKARIGDRIEAVGTVSPFVPGQRVEVRLSNRGDVVKKKNPFVRQVKGKKFGRFKLRSKPLVESGKYRVRVRKAPTAAQAGGGAKSKAFKLSYPDLDPGDSGPAVKMFNRLLRKQAYYAPGGDTYSAGTERAVMAFRKVNGMARNFQATPEIFATLAAGKGGFKIAHPGAGKHAEVDISTQVMALANNGKAQHVFHIATGAAATPSDIGGFTFYRKDPGFNSIGMYYSVYYNRGEATHGYKSVPPYPASHGCIRNPIPDSIFIYNWIDLGDRMYVYN